MREEIGFASRRTWRTCVFCGSSDISKEDVISKWLIKLLDESRGKRSGSPLTQAHALGPIDTKSRYYRDVCKCVCRACNSGWMNQIELRVKPMLTRLIQLETLEFELSACEAIAHWVALKTVLTTFGRMPVEAGMTERQAKVLDMNYRMAADLHDYRERVPDGITVFGQRFPAPGVFTGVWPVPPSATAALFVFREVGLSLRWDPTLTQSTPCSEGRTLIWPSGTSGHPVLWPPPSPAH